jgi:rare lipoprotein A (peptidoglycan hydrolase)
MKKRRFLEPSGSTLALVSLVLLIFGPVATDEVRRAGVIAHLKHLYRVNILGEKPSIYTKPYIVNNKTYIPQVHYYYDEVGLASWYGPGFHKRRTATGEIFNMHKVTGASKTLPLPCVARVTNLENGKYIDVKLIDRGPFMHDDDADKQRIIDLSHGAAQKLGFVRQGVAQVRVQCLIKESQELRRQMARKKRRQHSGV